jgi:hypothetical protein
VNERKRPYFTEPTLPKKTEEETIEKDMEIIDCDTCNEGCAQAYVTGSQ